jgi:hypothetical protein
MSRTPDHRPAFGPSAVAASLVAAIACVVGADIPADASRMAHAGDRALADRISAVADTLRSFDSIAAGERPRATQLAQWRNY